MGADGQLRFEPMVLSSAGFVPPDGEKWAQVKVYRLRREGNVCARELRGAAAWGGRVVLWCKPEGRTETYILPDFCQFLLSAGRLYSPSLPALFSHPLNLGCRNGFAELPLPLAGTGVSQ